MSLAATTTLVAVLWMISSCTASPDCSASYGNLATEMDRSGEGSENTSFVIGHRFLGDNSILENLEGLIILAMYKLLYNERPKNRRILSGFGDQRVNYGTFSELLLFNFMGGYTKIMAYAKRVLKICRRFIPYAIVTANSSWMYPMDQGLVVHCCTILHGTMYKFINQYYCVRLLQ